MTTHPSSEHDDPLIGLEQEWFQPILLPIESYGDYVRGLNQRLAELEARFAPPNRTTDPRSTDNRRDTPPA